MSVYSMGAAGLRRLWPGAAVLIVLAGCGSPAAPTTVTSPATNAVPTQPVRTRTQQVPTTPTTATTRPAKPRPDLARLLGQMIVARFQGPTPSAPFLRRVRAGQIGGVILFADNVSGGIAATRQLTEVLQRAAAQSGNPPLLIMVDQEGGPVKRLPGPPSLPAAEMTSRDIASAQGRATGAFLRSVGINLDLAPVADVEAAPNFLGARSFGSSPQLVGPRACAFAGGLASARVAFTLKHFPGLGLATGNTDLASVSIPASADVLRSDYRAYQRCGGEPLGLVMVSSASYPALGASLPAVMSPTIYQRELRLAVPGGSPLTISDDLQSPAIESQAAPARHAINAGLDLLLYAQTEHGSALAYAKLLSEARSGVVSVARLTAANRRIRALKGQLRG